MNLKLKFWDCNEKNIGFQLTHTKVVFPTKPRGIKMRWEHPTLRFFNNVSCIVNVVLYMSECISPITEYVNSLNHLYEI